MTFKSVIALNFFLLQIINAISCFLEIFCMLFVVIALISLIGIIIMSNIFYCPWYFK